jgi:transposase
MPPQFVRPFVKGNKNDYLDAEAIAEAVGRKNMRFVPLKSDSQLDMQALHRARQGWVRRRTSLVNQIRAFLLERGLPIRTGLEHLRERMPDLLANADGQLSAVLVGILQELWTEWLHLEQHIADAEAQLRALTKSHEACQLLQTIPGIGLITASALVCAVGNGQTFRRGRDLAAWLGLVPRQHSTGGINKLLRISRRGNSYLRQLLVHGARSIYANLKRDDHAIGRWLDSLAQRKKPSVAIVAMANKLARIAWAVLTTNQPYRPQPAANP